MEKIKRQKSEQLRKSQNVKRKRRQSCQTVSAGCRTKVAAKIRDTGKQFSQIIAEPELEDGAQLDKVILT